jgi:hypothetical protein
VRHLLRHWALTGRIGPGRKPGIQGVTTWRHWSPGPIQSPEEPSDGTTTVGMLRNATRDWWKQAHNSYELKTASSSSSWSSSLYSEVFLITFYCIAWIKFEGTCRPFTAQYLIVFRQTLRTTVPGFLVLVRTTFLSPLVSQFSTTANFLSTNNPRSVQKRKGNENGASWVGEWLYNSK